MKPTTRTWKRTLLTLSLFILAGAIINVAVAWGLPYVVSPNHPVRSFACDRHHEGNAWFAVLICQPGLLIIHESAATRPPYSIDKEQIDEDTYRSLIPRWSAFANDDPIWSHQTPTGGSRVPFPMYMEYASGWPMLALRASQHNLEPNRPAQHLGTLWMPKQLVLLGFAQAMPCDPIWPGFAINTIFYAAIMWMLFTASGYVRRRIRIMRHRCPACGYQIAPGTGSNCSECGTVLTSRKENT